MKKIILLLTFTLLLFSCSKDDDNSSSSNNNNNGNSFTNSMDYEFTITINGEVHKVKGNTTDGIPYGSVNAGINWINNQCIITNYHLAGFAINDVTASNYISGQNMQCLISFPNLLLGVNQASVTLVVGGKYLLFQSVSGRETYEKLLPINITDLGTGTLFQQTPPLPLYNFGQTLKGNYSGTIYLRRDTPQGVIYDIPVQLSIDFKALRMY